MNMSCNELPIEDLVAFVDGELGGVGLARVERHVAACAACGREADLLRRTGDLVARLPRHVPGPAFTARVLAATRRTAPRGALRRLWPVAAAAAAVLVIAVGARLRLAHPPADDGAGLATAEERAIAEDIYVLANLEALQEVDAEELISLVENLDILEGTEPEVTGMFGEVEGREGG